jgi:thiol:disulfide interchange protein DsbD
MKNNFYKILMAITLTVLAYKGQCQILHPVRWSFASKRINKTEAVVFLKANIDDGWHIYSQMVGDGGPVKTTFNFNTSADYAVVGATTEPSPITKYEKVFGRDVSYFASSVVFQQKIKIRKGTAIVTGSLNFMTCNDRQCLPPEDVEFSIPVK